MSGQVDHPALIPRYLAAQRLKEHRHGIRTLAEQPKLINEDTARLLSRHCIGVGGDHFQAVARRPVRDSAHMILDVEHVREFFVGPNHRSGRFEAVVRNLLCGRQDQVFLFLPPADDDRRQHDAGGDSRFRILLADEQAIFTDQLLTRVGLIAAKDGAYEVEHPFLRAFAERLMPVFTDGLVVELG
ncbi:hypothetical protein D3C86_1474880 [compost metagenome]